MKLDNDKQKKVLLEILKVINVSGENIDDIYKLKQAIISAEVSE